MTQPAAPRTPLLPPWLRSLAAHCAALLLVAAAFWVLMHVFLRLQVVVLTVLAALLLTALVQPVLRGLCRVGAPAWAAALGAVAFLLLVPVGIGYLVVEQALSQVEDLRAAVAEGIAASRRWLVEGPLSLSPDQIDRVSGALIRAAQGTAPAPVAGAAFVLQMLGTAAIALVLVFFLCKDGQHMWGWLLGRVPAARRESMDGAGRVAWETLTRYIAGTALIALIDAAGIGLGLMLLDVPMALSLTLLVFIGGFIPLLGATLSGTVAVVVALATQGFTTALAVAAIFVGVQQVEGNVLQPLIMGRAVRLHPAVILVTVSAGFVVGGAAGAALSVPLVAICYRVNEFLATRPDPRPPPADQAEAGAHGSVEDDLGHAPPGAGAPDRPGRLNPPRRSS